MQGAILIIGSLLWDSRYIRERWREQHLQLENMEHVQVPLEYGRRSGGRGNTFTMTLENNAPIGQAVLVPCISPVASIEDLLKEAEALWRAEHPSAKDGALGASWGCVGVNFQTKSSSCLCAWSQAFQDRITSNIPPVDEFGVLNLAWPVKADGMAIDVDFILATATRKELSQPATETIADAWIEQSAGHEHYFLENVKHGIRTHLDIAIWKRIEEKSPDWINQSNHADAIDILRRESAESK